MEKNSVKLDKIMANKPKSKKQTEIKKNSGPLLKIPDLKKGDSFILPESFKSQLNELCGGGYILMRLDARREPCVDCKFDTSADAIALYSYGMSYMNIVNNLTDQNIQNSIIVGSASNIEMMDEDDFEDDGESDTLDSQ